MGKIVVYYSSATSDLGVKKNQQSLDFLLEEKKITYEKVDLAQMEKPDRDALYAKAGTHVIPMVFKDDKYVGDYNQLQQLEEDELLDRTLNA